MQRLTIFFGILFSCLVLSGCKDETKGTLVVGTSLDNPPFTFSKGGEATGFEIELIKEVAKRLECKAIIKDMSFSTIIGALQSKSVDVAICAIAKTEQREKAVDFVGPYFTTVPTMVWAGESKEPSFVADTLIGAQLGSVYEPIAKELATQHTMKTFSIDKVTALVQELKNNRIVAFITGEFEARSIVAAQKNFHLKVLPQFKEAYSIALPKGSDKREKIAKALEEMQKDGTVAKLQQQWLA